MQRYADYRCERGATDADGMARERILGRRWTARGTPAADRRSTVRCLLAPSSHKVIAAISTGRFLTSGPQWSIINSGMCTAAVKV